MTPSSPSAGSSAGPSRLSSPKLAGTDKEANVSTSTSQLLRRYDTEAGPHNPNTPPFPASPALNPTSPRNFSTISSLSGSRELGAAVTEPLTFTSSSHANIGATSTATRRARRISPQMPPDTHSQADSALQLPQSIAMHAETQALMQMLSLVGSTFFEADKEGCTEEEEVEGPSGEVIGSDGDEGDGMFNRPKRGTMEPVSGTCSYDSAGQPSRSSSRMSTIPRARLRALLRDDANEDTSTPRGGQTPLAASVISPSGHRTAWASTSAKEFGTQSDTLAAKASQRRAAEQRPARAAFQASATANADDEGVLGDFEGGTDDDEHQSGCAVKQGSVADKRSYDSLGAGERDASSPLVDERDSPQASPSASLLQPYSPSLSMLGEPMSPTPDRDERDRLTGQLRQTFELDASETLVLAQPSWLFRSLLLQGHLYLTTGHLCFYAYLPSRDNKVVKTGPLHKRTRRTHRFSKHWASLKAGVLSWYDSDRDPYFPQGHIDLRKVSAIEPSVKHRERFKVTTPARRFTFLTESEHSRDAWMTALRKETFRAQNQGDSVRISIPLETILDIETALSVDQTEMVCITVIDEMTDFSVDEYFFLHLSNQDTFIRTVRELISEENRALSGSLRGETNLSLSRLSIRDSTGAIQGAGAPRTSLDGVPALPAISDLHCVEAQFDSVSTNPFEGALSNSTATLAPRANAERSSPTAQGTGAAISIPDRHRRVSQEGASDAVLSTTPRAAVLNRLSMESTHTYPPSPSASGPSASFEQIQKEAERGWAVPGWVREAPAKVIGRALAAGGATEGLASIAGRTPLSRLGRPRRKVVESWSRDTDADAIQDGSAAETDDDPATLSQSAHSVFSVLDAPDDGESRIDADSFAEQFRDTFGLHDDEKLIGHMHAHLYRVLPVAGRFFVSSGHLAFRSSGIAAKTVGRTLMLVPIQDVISVARHQAFRIGQHGLVITIRGHEELFVEVSSTQRRDELLSLIDFQLELVRKQGIPRKSASADASVRERSTALVLRDLSERIDGGFESGASVSADSSVVSGRGSEYGRSSSLSQSQGSAMISFTPESPLTFTMLTIGSRGDVQPYIALAKGLQADGHRVRIATHAEFGSWITGHGIEFSEIGGDPAELMRICVENGTFTVSFLREGVTKFRDWLDDLLASAWRACQGSDVVIECPSAIAGIHVAEALQVPYYRAFTMPWTRTRAYPHAFAVPSSKAGGNYNYMSYVIFDQMFWRASSFQINRWRKRMLGLQPTNLDKLEQHKVPFIYNFSPSLVPRPLDWFEWIHVTGFWFLDNPDNSSSRRWEPPADLVSFIQTARANDRKLVYIGWGSIVVSDAEAVTRCVLQAVKKSGVCAILSKGWSDRLSHKKSGKQASAAGSIDTDTELWKDVFQVTSVPHDWLFPQIDAACHHGGAGTLGASLRAGLPTVVKPYFGDQFFWGQQIESLGVGSCVRNLTVDNLAAALTSATTNPKQIERARKLGEQIRSEDGIGNAIKAIYRDLDYARSRIKRNTKLPDNRQARRLTTEANEQSNDDDQDQGHTSDEWSDVGGGPWSPGMSSQGDPSSSLILNASAS
ncbi:hypothetical protein BCV70DRAFT_186689 [Testicularia cyperi]|uniref:Sterol 3-beta-glucosyltransferase n=1 Tax=Testicularia cyperi TaxID=1882483 RepID=A0A317XTA6_9BASI|nr:hypothetical protein BCV70DRAFT_186689 [Testicularia cyperi]